MNSEELPEAVLNTISRYFAEPLKEDDAGQIHDIRVSAVRQDEAFVLASLVRSVAPRRTLEFGLATAGSCIAIAAARRSLGLTGRHLVFDPFQATLSGNVGLRQIRKAGLEDAVEWVDKKAEDYLPIAYMNGEEFDFVFEDASKSIGASVVNAFYIDKVLKPGGTVAFHDSLIFAKSVAVRYLIFNCGYKVIPIGPDSWGNVALRCVRYAIPLGWHYAAEIIPKMYKSMVALRKPIESLDPQ